MGGFFIMSNTKDTVENICQIISDWRGESATNTNASRIRAISRSNIVFSKRHYWRTHILPDQTTTGDGSTSTFTIGSATYPMRLKGLTELFVGGTTEDKRVALVDYFAFKNQVNNDNGARVAYEYFDAANDVWKVKINPAPDNGATIYYTYFWQAPKLDDVADTVVCENMEIIAHMALSEIYFGEDEDDKAIAESNLAERLIIDLIGTETMPAKGQTYSMTAIENSITPRGIGSY